MAHRRYDRAVKVEVPAIEQRVSAVAAAVDARLAEVTQDVVDLLIREIPPLREDERLVSLLSASVAENVATVLHMFQHGIDPEAIETPAAAVEYARRLAQRGVPIAALVRAYRIGHSRFLQWCFDALGAGGPDGIEGAASQRMTQRSFTYIDRISEQVIEIYETERDRWLHNRATVRAVRVRAVLAGDPVDLDATESMLGYRLRRRHVALVLWLADDAPANGQLVALERIAVGLAERAGALGPPLFVPCDEASAWVWLPVAEPDPDVRAVDGIDVCIAVGDPGAGVEGFRRSHQQATQTQAVALAAGNAAPGLTRFGDIRPIALMASDLDATRAWVLETLGALAIDDAQHARLRMTLRIFLSTGGSYTSTAERLTMHKNTVHYRIVKAEEARGRPIQPDRLDVELALLACDALGPAVLQAPA
jgi:DNA-binding PucR family transcriptional regulator